MLFVVSHCGQRAVTALDCGNGSPRPAFISIARVASFLDYTAILRPSQFPAINTMARNDHQLIENTIRDRTLCAQREIALRRAQGDFERVFECETRQSLLRQAQDDFG